MKASAILSYVCAGIYAVCAAWHFSLGVSSYWLFVVLGLFSMYVGILTTGIREGEGMEDTCVPQKKNRGRYLAVTLISIVAPPAFILNLIAYWGKQQASDSVVSEQACRKGYIRLAAASLCVVLLSSLAAMAFQSSGFRVSVTSRTLTKAMTEEYNQTPLNGNCYVIEDPVLHYAYDIYKPATATEETKAPVVFVMPGFNRTKQTQGQYCIELARRGFVVFCIDPGSQGNTTTPGYEMDEDGNYKLDEKGKRIQISATTQANGLNYLVQYVYNNTDEFNYIDRSRIGATGHSAGGGNVVTTARDFAGNSYEESIIKALYISGYIKLSSINSYQGLNCNAALDYGYYDEGRYRYLSEMESFETAAIRFINEVNGTERQYDSFVLDYGYGNMDNGTYRIIHSDKVFHAFQPYDTTSIAYTTDFFCDTLGVETDLDPLNQIWWGKEISTAVSLIAGLVFMVALSGLLLTTNFFGSVKGEKVKMLRRQTTSDRVIFWTTTVLSAVIACLDYIPLAGLSILLFPEAHATKATYFFPARMINAVMLWAVVNGIIGLVIFFVSHYMKNAIKTLDAKVHGKLVEYDAEPFKAISIGWKDFAKTLLLSFILFGTFYLLVEVVSWIFHVDFRFMFISASPLNERFVVTWLMYIPFFFIFYISNSIRVNCGMTFENWGEGKRMLIGALANSVGLMFILVINYVTFFKTGIVYYTYSPSGSEVWLFINMVFGLVPLMFALPIFTRIFCKQTNRVWLGAMTMCMIFVMMSLASSVSYIPL